MIALMFRYFIRFAGILVLLFSFVPSTTTARSQVDEAAGLRVVRSDSRGLLLALDTPDFDLTGVQAGGEIYQRLEVPGAALTGAAGSPQLPAVSAVIGVPPGASVSWNFVEVQPRQLSGRTLLAPAPSP
ncbi:MAG: hypothetical protein EHM70_23575, partial [Chloroflexota bacterium]